MPNLANIDLKIPTLEDGIQVFHLVASCPPLDGNSNYCNLLQCSHFANTSVAAKQEGELVGFISAYIIPDRSNTLFVWQVAVSKEARGIGLASRMLAHIINRPICAKIQYIETSITPDNQASWKLFERFSKSMATQLHSYKWMDRETHFAGQHDSESLVRIGPFHSHHLLKT